MIKAGHKRWAGILYDFYIGKLLKRNFNNFFLLNNFPDLPKNSGLIITPNHFSWWDGFFIDFVCKKYLNRKIYLMMLEEQLERYWFFRKVGAFSINLNDNRNIATSILYSKNIINNPDNFLVIYPQGELVPFDKKPVVIKRGLASIIKNLSIETFVLPFAFKIQYGKEMKPDILGRAGNLLSVDSILNDFNTFKSAFENNLNELNNNNLAKDKIKFF